MSRRLQHRVDRWRSISAATDKQLCDQIRAADARRAVLFSATQKLQTVIQGSDAEYRKEQLRRDLEKSTQQRRVTLLRELADARFQLAQINLKLAAGGDASGSGAGRKISVAEGDRPGLTIIRGGEQIPGVLETALMPGDVVAFRLGGDQRTRQLW